MADERAGENTNRNKWFLSEFYHKMYMVACSPSSSIFSEMLELNAARSGSKKDELEDSMSVDNFDAAKMSPVFYGRYGQRISDSVCENREGDDGTSTRSSVLPEFDPSVMHPALYGYVLLDKKPTIPREAPALPPPKECKLVAAVHH